MVATRRARQTTLRGSDGGYAKAARTAKGAEEESAHAAEGEAAPLKTHRKPTAAVHSTEAVCHVVRVAALYHGTEVPSTHADPAADPAPYDPSTPTHARTPLPPPYPLLPTPTPHT